MTFSHADDAPAVQPREVRVCDMDGRVAIHLPGLGSEFTWLQVYTVEGMLSVQTLSDDEVSNWSTRWVAS